MSRVTSAPSMAEKIDPGRDIEDEEEEEEEETAKDRTSMLGKYPYSDLGCASRKNMFPKSECFSEDMAREIRKKAEIRAQRWEDIANPVRQKAYRAHRYRIKTAKPLVDSSNPMDGKIPYRNRNYLQRIMDFARIERENMVMLKHLAEIIHGKGTVDTRWEPQNIKTINHRSQSRHLRLLKITFENLSLLKRIQSQKPFYSRRRQLNDYGKQEQIMSKMSLYPLYWQLQASCKWGSYATRAKQNSESNSRPRCFLALGNAEKFLGKVVIELFADLCPMTAENFRGLCTGEYGPTYKCSTIHRVIKDVLWQGGDVTGQNGSGSKSAFGENFPDENFKVKHDKPGIVTMASCGPDTNGSQFMIIAKKLSVLDGTNVAFGQVVAGMDVLKQLYNEVTTSGRPKKKIFVVECGELSPGTDPCEVAHCDGSEEEEDEEEEEGAEETAASDATGEEAEQPPKEGD